MRLGLFAVAVAALSAAAFVVKGLPFAPDAFAANDAARLTRFAQLDEHAMAELKVQHALARPPNDVGLFGNSRIVQVSAEDLGDSAGSFFNFAVPGSSLRQSATLLETLSGGGRSPRVAVVSLDHFELSFYSPAEWPAGPRGWMQAVSDVRWALERGEFGLAARAAHDHVKHAGRRIAEGLSFARIAARLGFMAPEIVPTLREFITRFRSDGSRPLASSVGAMEQTAPRAGAFVLHRLYLMRDLERLAAVQETGTRMLIYESPLSPANRRAVAEAPREPVESLRRDWLAACDRLGLVCLPAPDLGDEGRPPAWPDCCHAPAALLGSFIADALRRAAAG